MPKEDETILRYMSEKLKHEPYISKPNSKVFLAEIATIIIHILQEDGKYDLQIDDCFYSFKDRIFDYSIRKIQYTKNFTYFKDKGDDEITITFLEMLDLYFSKKEIRSLVQYFNEIETIDDDYQFIFKKKDSNTDSHIFKEKKNDKAFTIDRTTKEKEIREYFNNKIAEGYYTDIYKLLVDFTLMMYRKGAFSIDLSLPSFDSTITFINSMIKNYWIHSLRANELEAKFSYLWKRAKPIIINRAITALQIPYKIDLDGSFILTHKNDPLEVIADIIESKKTQEASVEKNQQTSNHEDANKITISHIYCDDVIESKISELFDISEKSLIEEDILLDEINSLLYSRAWNNVYDLFGDIQYIIYQQKKIANRAGKSILYHNVKLSQFEGKYNYFLKTFHKKIKLDSRLNSRKSFRDIWHRNYAASTIEKMGLQFNLIQSVDNLGNITLKHLYNIEEISEIITDEQPLVQVSASAIEGNAQEQLNAAGETIVEENTPKDSDVKHNEDNEPPQIETESEPAMIHPEFNQINESLLRQYNESDKYIISEQKNIDLHRYLVESRKWSNISQCVASIAYIIIRQIEFANSLTGLHYLKLRKFSKECKKIQEQENFLFEDGNHTNNIGIVEERLIQQYGITTLIDFFKKIIGTYDVAADGTIIFKEEKPEENISVQDDTEDDMDDDNNDGCVEKEGDNKKTQEPSTDIPEFDSNASYNEEGTKILLAKLGTYSNNSLIKEIFEFYFLDIEESFSHVRTKGELWGAYQHFKEYTAINFISKTNKEKLLEVFRCFIYDLLDINKK